MTSPAEHAVTVRKALDGLHDLSLGAGDSHMYGLEAALHRTYTMLDEAFAALAARADELERQVEHAHGQLARAGIPEGSLNARINLLWGNAARADELERERDYTKRECDAAVSNAEIFMVEWKQRAERAEAALREIERSALKAAQLLPMTLSTSVERDHRDDHPSWAGWLLRHKVLPVARAALGEQP